MTSFLPERKTWLYHFFARKATISQKRWSPWIFETLRAVPIWAIPSLFMIDITHFNSIQLFKTFWNIETRQPTTTGIFCAISNFCKEGCQKDENVFTRKKTLFLHHIFWYFQRSKSSDFLLENLIIRAKKIFKEIIPFDTHSTANLLPLANLKKIIFFSEKSIYFIRKKPKFWTFWGI